MDVSFSLKCRDFFLRGVTVEVIDGDLELLHELDGGNVKFLFITWNTATATDWYRSGGAEDEFGLGLFEASDYFF